MAPVDELLEDNPLAFGHQLDSPIAAIAYPAGNTEKARLFLRCGAKVDALHLAVYNAMHPRPIH